MTAPKYGERQRIFSSVSFATCSQGQIPFCYTGRRACAGATYPCCAIRERVVIDSTYEDKLCRTTKFAGAFCYNVPKSCAALSCRACVDETTCVAEQYLTLRTGCSRGRTPKVVRPQQRKNPLPYSFSQRSHVGNLRQIRKQGKGRSSKRKGTHLIRAQRGNKV